MIQLVRSLCSIASAKLGVKKIATLTSLLGAPDTSKNVLASIIYFDGESTAVARARTARWHRTQATSDSTSASVMIEFETDSESEQDCGYTN
jgi:hypothetical protein